MDEPVFKDKKPDNKGRQLHDSVQKMTTSSLALIFQNAILAGATLTEAAEMINDGYLRYMDISKDAARRALESLEKNEGKQ